MTTRSAPGSTRAALCTPYLLLSDCLAVFGPEREAALARELTKLHESTQRASLEELYRRIDSGEEPARGECVVLIAGAAQQAAAPEQESDDLLKALLAEGISPSTAAAVARRLYPQAKRRDLYQRAMTLHGDQK